MKKRRVGRFLLWTFFTAVLSFAGFFCYYMERVIPDRINIIRDQ